MLHQASEPADYPGATARFHPTYRIGAKGRQRGWYHHDFGTIDECRNFLRKQADNYAAGLVASRERAAATRAKRREDKIAKVTRDYLLGKHIGNRQECAICSRDERGVGSECWPNLMDRLAHQAPQCEAKIVELEASLAATESKTFEEWFKQQHYYDRYKDDAKLCAMEARSFYQNQETRIGMLKRELADQRHLLVAARKWNEKLLTAPNAHQG
jgi:hypothetical protein